MKVISNRNNPRSDAKAVGFEMPSSLQHSLTTAIHGAFEVAVEIAVVEVTKLVSVAAGDMYEKIQQENETLKEELRKARSVIDSLCCEAGNSGEKSNQQLLQETNPAAAHDVDQFSPNRGKTEHNKDDGQCLTSQNDNFGLQKNNWASNSHEEEQNTGQTFCNSESIGNKMDIFHTCGVKVERLNQSSMSEDPPGVPLAEDQGPQFVKVKVENPEDIPVVKDVPVDSFKEDAISHLQSEIMQEWTLGACHFDEHDASPQANVHPSNMNFSLDTAHEPSTSLSNFPVRVPDRAPAQDPPPPPPPAALHAYKNNVRRNQGNAKLNFHTCKLCGLNFPLPSLLRRHFGQCQQKLNQRFFVPAVGGKRTKLQLYPPGCSPYRCTECDREFNRLENLKTHLRIHTGERPYKCSVCSTAFRHSGALTRHFRIHTGEKPYVCGLCGKSFRNCGGLKFHQRSHNK